MAPPKTSKGTKPKATKGKKVGDKGRRKEKEKNEESTDNSKQPETKTQPQETVEGAQDTAKAAAAVVVVVDAPVKKTKPIVTLLSKSVPAPNSFQSLVKPRPLSSGVLSYVASQGFQRMTPVQAATIPHFLSHKDVVVQSVTGSGKTLAFLIPVLELLQQKTYKRSEIGALILSPTRELALQTFTVARSLCASCQQPEPLLLVGGGSSSSSSSSSSSGTNSRPVTADLTAFATQGSDLVIGTPGRVNDILSRYTVMACSELACLVLDEADVLLNMGFATTLQTILARLPKMRRTALFSATQQSSSSSSSLTEWMYRVGVRNPVWIDVTIVAPAATAAMDANGNATAAVTTEPTNSGGGGGGGGGASKPQATPTSLTNYYVVTALDEKLSRLAVFLQQHRKEKVIVFFLTCSCVDFFGTALQRLFSSKDSNEGTIELLHGKMVQKRREKTMARFRDDTDRAVVLFCTDVAARGLDVSDIDWVIQFDAPSDPAMFIHRAGRTARAGKSGQSLVFLTHKEEAYIDFLRLRRVPLVPLPCSELCSSLSDDTDLHQQQRNEKRQAKAGLLDGADRPLVETRRILSGADPTLSIDDILPKVRDLAMADRDILEKGTQAFTSFIRAYKEHQCAFIFRFASLDLGLLATSFCLLRLPKMPELKDVLLKHKGKLPRFTTAGHDVDIFAIPYINKAREQARQKRLAEELASGGKNVKRIQAEQRKVDKEQRVLDRRTKAVEKGRNPDKKRGRNAQLIDEWEDLAKEERLVKKLRRGKITKEEFKTQMSEG